MSWNCLPLKQLIPTDFLADNCWSLPISGWHKCDIGVAWDKNSAIAGVYWILRNDYGIVLLHSRRAFSFVRSELEAFKSGCLMSYGKYEQLTFQQDHLWIGS